MIEWIDRFGIKRAIEFTETDCGKWVNLTLYAPTKHTSGSTVQISKDVFNELVNLIIKLKD